MSQKSNRLMPYPGVLLLDSDINKYQQLYVRYFGEALDRQQARAELTLLVRQLEIVYQPITVSQFDRYIQLAAGKDLGNDPLA